MLKEKICQLWARDVTFKKKLDQAHLENYKYLCLKMGKRFITTFSIE